MLSAMWSWDDKTIKGREADPVDMIDNEVDTFDPEGEKRLSQFDMIERGICGEMTGEVECLAPVLEPTGLRMDMSLDTGDYHLYRLVPCADRAKEDEKVFLLHAKRFGKGFHIYPHKRNHVMWNGFKPCFTFQYSSNKTRNVWTLYQHLERYSRSPSMRRTSKPILQVKQASRRVGDGTYNHMTIIRKEDLVDVGDDLHDMGHMFATKEPKWNPRSGSLVLKFKGRPIEASSRNFHLCFKDVDEDGFDITSCCQFGKLIDQPDFTIDIDCPLSIMEAFAAGLSTHYWGVELEQMNTELTHGWCDDDYSSPGDSDASSE